MGDHISIGDGYVIPPLFWPTVVLPGILTMLPMVYPFIEARLTKDKARHNLLQRPRDVPERTGLGCHGDHVLPGADASPAATTSSPTSSDISLNAMTWAGRIGLILLPPLAYYVTYRICLGLQQHDREVLAHGVETGIIRRLPDGKFERGPPAARRHRRARPRRSAATTPAGSSRRR